MIDSVIDWIRQYWESLTWSKIAVGTLLLLVSIVVSYAAVIFVMVKIPSDYFSSNYVKNHQNDKHFMLRWGGTIMKNIVGFLIVLLGIAMIFGPGPGALTILLGIILMDIPGKRPLETKLIKQPAVFNAINNLRAKYKKPPLIVD